MLSVFFFFFFFFKANSSKMFYVYHNGIWKLKFSLEMSFKTQKVDNDLVLMIIF